MTNRESSSANGGKGRPNRTSFWAFAVIVGVLLIYVLNGMFMPVVDVEQQQIWATETAAAELGIPPAETSVPAEEGSVAAPESAVAEVTPESEPTDTPAEEVPAEPAEAVQEEATEVPVEAPTEIPTEAPTETPTEAPTETPTEAPTATPTPRPTNTPTPAPTRVPARINGLPTILFEDLPPQAHDTIALIDEGGPFPFDRDGITFQNRERLLPNEPRGYYREYTVITPGERDRGARRIIEGEEGELYYTDDHYDSFSYVVR